MKVQLFIIVLYIGACYFNIFQLTTNPLLPVNGAHYVEAVHFSLNEK